MHVSLQAVPNLLLNQAFERNSARGGLFAERDTLRRLMVHLAQGSDTVPATLDISKKVALDGEDTVQGPTIVGKGSYGVVYRGTYTSRVIVAVKKLNIDNSSHEKQVSLSLIPTRSQTRTLIADTKLAYLELLSTWSLRSDRILRLYGITERYETLALVFEWMDNGSALQYLRDMLQGRRHPPRGRIVDLSNTWVSGSKPYFIYTCHIEGGKLNVIVDQ